MRTLALLALLLAGCTGPTRYVQVQLPAPLPPLLPMVQAHELECLTDSAYERMLVRETRLREYAASLLLVIETHNEGVNQK